MTKATAQKPLSPQGLNAGLCISLIALLLVAFFMAGRTHHWFTYMDETDVIGQYLYMDRAWMHSGSFAAMDFKHIGPGMPILMLPAYHVPLRNTFTFLLWQNRLVCVLTLLIIYLWAAQFTSRSRAILIAGLSGLSASFLLYGNNISSDIYFTAAFFLMLWLFEKTRTGHLWTWIVLACVAGFLIWMRYNGLFAVAGMAALLFRRDWKKALLFTGILALWGLPIWLVNLQHHGNPFFNDRWMDIAYGMHGSDSVPQAEFDVSPWRGMGDLVTSDPGGFALWWLRNLGSTLLRLLWYISGKELVLLLPFLIIGLAVQWRAIRQKKNLYWSGVSDSLPKSAQEIGIILLIYLIGNTMMAYMDRLYMIMMPPLVVLYLALLGPLWPRPKAWLQGLGLLLVGGMAVFAADKIAKGHFEAYEFHAYDLATGLREKCPSVSGTNVLARKPHIPYFMSAEYIPLPHFRDLDSWLGQARALKADFVLITYTEYKLMPKLWENVEQYPEIFERFCFFDDGHKNNGYLFRLHLEPGIPTREAIPSSNRNSAIPEQPTR